jgi:hypothetical protein
LGVWSHTYEFDLINAESNGKIPARYQEKYMSDSYDIVLVFCDTDGNPFEDYEMIKAKINHIHGVENAAGQVIMFGNLCTMQIVLLHFDDVRLTSHRKEDNRLLIRQLTGVRGYRAKQAQRNQMNELITANNYNDMIDRVSQLSNDDRVVGSSNFDLFAGRFSEETCTWIDMINQILES